MFFMQERASQEIRENSFSQVDLTYKAVRATFSQNYRTHKKLKTEPIGEQL